MSETQKSKMGRKPKAQDKLTAAGVDEIASLISDGTTYREIARKYQVGLGSLCAWIESDSERSRACATARAISAQTWDEKAEEWLIAASDNFELAKAREIASHYRWRAKAVNPKKYGDKQEQEQPTNLLDKVNELINKLPS